jgi:hypothetical protein
MPNTPPPSRGFLRFPWDATRGIVLSANVDAHRVELFAIVIAFLGVPIVCFYSGLTRATASWLLCGAGSFSVGMTTGFIFAVPRATSNRVNSNLELISDWLTKILVGVGLTQLSQIPDRLARLAKFAAGGETSSGPDRAFALFVILYFMFAGFVGAYLETRVFLTGAFFRAEPTDPASSERLPPASEAQSDLTEPAPPHR